MSEIKCLSVFLSVFLLVTSCGGEGNGEESENNKTRQERLPKLKEEDFRTHEIGGFEIWSHKKMSSNRRSGDVIYSASYLPDEYHMEVKVVPVSRFRKASGFPSKKSSQLLWFAEEHSQKLQRHLISLNTKPALERVMSNERICYKQQFSGKEFGFPFEKTYFLRYYQFDDKFVSITCWTVTKNAEKFKKISQFMGMKLTRSN